MTQPLPTTTDLVDALVAARRGDVAITSHGWQAALPDAEAAYGVQDAVAAALGWFGGAAPGHWKSGGPSRENTLTHAPLPPHAVRASPADFSDLTFHRPGIEAEVALRLGRDVDAALAASLDGASASELIDAMTVTIEVVDSRWDDGARESALLRLADMQMHGALAVGAWVPWQPRDWSQQLCRVTIGEEIVERTGTLSLVDPAWRSQAGTVVTTGTWCGVLPARRGDRVVAEFPGIGSTELVL